MNNAIIRLLYVGVGVVDSNGACFIRFIATPVCTLTSAIIRVAGIYLGIYSAMGNFFSDSGSLAGEGNDQGELAGEGNDQGEEQGECTAINNW